MLAALGDAAMPPPSAAFTTTTWHFIQERRCTARAGAFPFGRDDLIPRHVRAGHQGQRGRARPARHVVDYLSWYTEVDGEEHTTMAMQMLADLRGDDEARRSEGVADGDRRARRRVQLWTADP
jgi:hypothetical protein